jgi:hypothetical protein
MRKTRHEIGMINGIPYKLSFDQLENQQYCDDRYKKTWLWFLWIDGYYQGNFRLKREAIEFAENKT